MLISKLMWNNVNNNHPEDSILNECPIIVTGGSRDGAGRSFWESFPYSQDDVHSHKHHLSPQYLRAIDYSQPQWQVWASARGGDQMHECEHVSSHLLKPLGCLSIFMSSSQSISWNQQLIKEWGKSNFSGKHFKWCYNITR